MKQKLIKLKRETNAQFRDFSPFSEIGKTIKQKNRFENTLQ